MDIATLNQVLTLHCTNACWDVRDSTLGFLRFFLVTFNGEFVINDTVTYCILVKIFIKTIDCNKKGGSMYIFPERWRYQTLEYSLML